MKSKSNIFNLCKIIAFPLFGIAALTPLFSLTSCGIEKPFVLSNKQKAIEEIKSLNDVLFFKLSSFTSFDKIAETMQEDANVSGTVFNLLKYINDDLLIYFPSFYNANNLIYLVSFTGGITKSIIPQEDEKWIELKNVVELFKTKMEDVENVETIQYYKNANFSSPFFSSDYLSKKIKSGFAFLGSSPSTNSIFSFNNFLEGLNFSSIEGINPPSPIDDNTTLDQLLDFLKYDSSPSWSSKIFNIELGPVKEEIFAQFTIELNNFLNLILNNQKIYNDAYDLFNSSLYSFPTLSLFTLSNDNHNDTASKLINEIKNINQESTLTVGNTGNEARTIFNHGGFLEIKKTVTPTSSWAELEKVIQNFKDESDAFVIKHFAFNLTSEFVANNHSSSNFFFTNTSQINTNIISQTLIDAFNALVSDENKISSASTFQTVFIDSSTPDEGALWKAKTFAEIYEKWFLLDIVILKFVSFQYLTSIPKINGYDSSKKLNEVTYNDEDVLVHLIRSINAFFDERTPLITPDTTFAQLNNALSATGAVYTIPLNINTFEIWSAVAHYSYLFVTSIVSFA